MSAELLPYEDASKLVTERARQISRERLVVERVELGRAAGRALAEPVIADRDLPPFARSTRDGFACRAADAARHEWMPVTGMIRAGQPHMGSLPVGAAIEIMTGAAVPEGADAVVMIEHVETGNERVRLAANRAIAAGENIVPRGAEAHAAAELLSPGARLGAAQVALAAACGYAELAVFAKPRVAILATGDELVRVQETPGPGEIRNSNSPMLAALVSAHGGRALVLPTAADDADALDEAIAMAARAEMLLVSGGVSAGKFDLVEEALRRAGASFHFTGVRIQPGKPTVFGELPRIGSGEQASQIFFGLPGNPISSAATFLLFAVPVLAALSGCADLGPRFALARVKRECKGKPGLTRFVPAVCTFRGAAGQQPEVEAVGWQGSGDLAAFARSNCFLVVPDGTEMLATGQTATLLLH